MSSPIDLALLFYRNNGRMPNVKEPAGNFIRLCRAGLHQKFHARLDRACPGWQNPDMAELPAGLKRLVDFYNTNKRLPKACEPVYTVLRNTRDGHHSEWHATLNNLIPGWKEKKGPGVLTDAAKIERINKLVDYYKAHNKFPGHNQPGYSLLRDMRKGKHRELHHILDKTAKYWRKACSSVVTAAFDEENFHLLNVKLTEYIHKSRNIAVNNIKIEQKTITLSDGNTWTGAVKIFPTLGQGCDFDNYRD